MVTGDCTESLLTLGIFSRRKGSPSARERLLKGNRRSKICLDSHVSYNSLSSLFHVDPAKQAALGRLSSIPLSTFSCP